MRRTTRSSALPFLLSLTLTLSLAAVAGCKKGGGATSAGGDQAPLRLAFVSNNSSDFWNIGEKGLRKAEKDFGISVSMFRPLKGEVSDQQRFLEDILVQGFQGVAISPINPDAMTGIFEKVAAKIPLVTADSDAPKSPRKVYVGTNNVAAGQLVGETARKALEEAHITKGKVALFVGRIDMQNAIERKKGIEDTLGKVPGIEILPVFLDKADRALAKKNVEDAIAHYPNLILRINI